MRKVAGWILTILLTTAMSFAQGTPSSKATAVYNTAVGCTVASQSTIIGATLPQSCHDIFSGAAVDVTPDNFATVMSSTIKVSNSQSLFVSPSLVTGLYTQTTVKSKPGGGASQAVAEGGVYMRAIITNQATGVVQVAYPVAACKPSILGCYSPTGSGPDYGVILDQRIQSLTQDITQCVVNVVVGGTPGTGSCNFDLTTDLILSTTSAHSYNFIFPNVGVGVYTVDIQLGVDANANVSGSGTAIGGAAYGLGSLTVEGVRLVNGFSF